MELLTVKSLQHRIDECNFQNFKVTEVVVVCASLVPVGLRPLLLKSRSTNYVLGAHLHYTGWIQIEAPLWGAWSDVSGKPRFLRSLIWKLLCDALTKAVIIRWAQWVAESFRINGWQDRTSLLDTQALIVLMSWLAWAHAFLRGVVSLHRWPSDTRYLEFTTNHFWLKRQHEPTS